MSLVLTHQLGDPPTAARRWRYHLTWLLLAAAVLTVAVVCRVPQSSVTVPGLGSALPEICLSRRLLGLDCPGCGLSRCFVCLAHGEVARAWQFNPAGLLWFAALAWQVPYRAVQLYLLRRGRELKARRGITEGLILLLMAACLAQWLVKMTAWLL
jgi:hypothetical protein